MRNRKSKWIWGSIFLFLLITSIFVYLFRETILIQAGNFMAPAGDYEADAAILEGAEFISTGIITSGMNLLSTGKVKRIVIVLQDIAPAHRPYGIRGNYPDVVRQTLKNIGLNEKEYKIIVVSVRKPITLKEAAFVLKDLHNENIHSAILLSQGFHTRRSYLVYQYVGNPLQIKIRPHACFTNYQFNEWWTQQSGVRDFTTECLKLFYYLVRGYIPFKFSY